MRRVVTHIARDSPRSAEHIHGLILETGASLGTLSRRGRRVVPPDDGEVREVFVFSWRLVYEVLPDEVWIHTLVHGARDLPTDALPDP